jgi:zinc transporter ZupT
MATLASIRDKLESKVFTAIGSTAVLAAATSSSTDKWGDGSVTLAAGTNITIVPYGYISPRVSAQPFGDLKEGDVIVVVRYTQSIGVYDELTFNGTTYVVKQIEQFFFQDGVIAKQVLLAKKLG